MYTHRGAYLNALGKVVETGLTLRQRLSVDAADVPLQRLVLPVGRGRGGRHPRLPAQGRARPRLGADRRPRASPTTTARPRSTSARQRPKAHRLDPARDGARRPGRRPRRPCWPGSGAEFPARPRLRADRDVRPAHRLRVAPGVGRAARRTSRRACSPARGRATSSPTWCASSTRTMNDVPRDGQTLGEVVMRGNNVVMGYFQQPRGDRRGVPRRLVPLRRPGGDAPGRLHRAARPEEGHHHLRRREHLDDRGRAGGRPPPGRAGVRRGRHPRREMGRAPEGVRDAQAGADGHRRARSSPSAAGTSPTSSARPPSSSASCRRRRPGKVQKFVLREREWKGREKRIN